MGAEPVRLESMTGHVPPEDPAASRFAVIGDPVEHSYSPAIHESFFRRHGLAATYERITVSRDEVGGTLRELSGRNYRGINVTYPLKNAVIPSLTNLDPTSACLRSVNTLRACEPSPGRVGFEGFSTDGPGFLASLRSVLGFDPAGRSVLLLGAGGAARSILGSLLDAHVTEVKILNRTERSWLELGLSPGEAGARVSFHLQERADHDALFEVDLVVNATSLGLAGVESPFPWPLERIRPGTKVVDLNYRKDGPTPFLAALPRGLHTQDGKAMLLYQAAYAFELWWGFFPDVNGACRDVFEGDL